MGYFERSNNYFKKDLIQDDSSTFETTDRMEVNMTASPVILVDNIHLTLIFFEILQTLYQTPNV